MSAAAIPKIVAQALSRAKVTFDDFNRELETFDYYMNRQLKINEDKYLETFNSYIKNKGIELKELITALENKNSNEDFKQAMISRLRIIVVRMQNEAVEVFSEIKNQEKQIKELKTTINDIQGEK